jgi:nicotinamidase/pyrazinamidase
MAAGWRLSERDVLLVVDVQKDFCTGGRLAIPRGEEVVPMVNALMGRFQHVILTQDWHPADHRSFASNCPGRNVFETIPVEYGEQTLWPDHCVQGTSGAEFHPGLNTTSAELILRKGFRREIDSYSAFRENDRRTPTGLGGYLRERGISRIIIAGLALDFCVRFSAEDARHQDFEVAVIENACRGIDLDGSVAVTRRLLSTLGVALLSSEDLTP